MAQNISVSGKVKNKTTGDPLVGATVSVQGASTNTVTNATGSFTISTQKGSTLIISYAGMVAAKLKVTKEGTVDDVLLEDNNAAMTEVVVVGYGTQRITKVSGAISTVKAADIEKLNPVRAEEALQGRASGVTVISAGSPGAKPTVLIRGIPSFTGTDPVVIIDGVPQTLTDFNSINAADIESINVLKDAATTAIYGVKGGNGVIVVTTKSGKKNQKTQLTVSSNYGVQQVLNKIGVLNATEYAAIINEGSVSAGGALIFPNLSTIGVGTNWQDQVFKDAAIQTHTVTARGGSEKMGYFLLPVI
ncbi:MAG: TonB-dependent receptor plug domain-containing protein [Ferruginibacter sp.]